MKQEILFSFNLSIKNVKSDRDNYKIDNIKLEEIKLIANGSIYIFFYYKKNRDFIIIETGILDYIDQYDSLFYNIEKLSNYETFTHSIDYTNSIDYKYSLSSNELKIFIDSYCIQCDYLTFKKSFTQFRRSFIEELLELYPELINNKEFSNYFIKWNGD